jgi:Spy/CpxP family protein refolding chaperone
MSHPARAPWQHPRVILTLLLVFLAGGVTGAVAMRYRLHERLNRIVAASSKEARSDAVIQNFKTQLDLSPEQTQKIALVLEDYRHYYESLEDQLEDLRATGKNRILEVLNPQQRKKFEKMMAELVPQLQPGKK